MVHMPAFNPFEDRTSRNIRNGLSSALNECIELNDISPTIHFVEQYRDCNHQYTTYIEQRIAAYRKAIARFQDGPPDPLWRGLVLWDLTLFFEMHEVLEHAWYAAEGETKKVLQALIRAAGMYIKLEYGYRLQAEKMAAKAIPVLEKNKDVLAQYFPPDRLLDALKNTTIPPPTLLDL